MGLALVLGPAKAGKIAHLLDGLSRRARARSRPDRPEPRRTSTGSSATCCGGSARCSPARSGRSTTSSASSRSAAADAQPVAGDAQRTLVARRALARTPLAGLDRSARFAGFADALLGGARRARGGLLDARSSSSTATSRSSTPPTARSSTPRPLGPRPAPPPRRRAARSELDAWDGRPVFAYGFEDLTGAEWGLLEALSARGGGDRLAAVRARPRGLRVAPADAGGSRLARRRPDRGAPGPGRASTAPPRSRTSSGTSSTTSRRRARPLDGAIRFFEGAGARGTLELVAEEVRELAAAGTPLEEIALVVPSVERWRAPVETVLGTLGIPFAVEGRVRLGQTPFGQALLALLRFAWQQGGRRDLYALSPLAVLRLRAHERRLPRGPAPRPAVSRGDDGRGGDDQASRRAAAPAARGAARRPRPRRGRPRAGGRDAARRARPRGAAGRRGDPRRPPRLRRGRAAARRARRLDRRSAASSRADDVIARSSAPRCGSARAAERGRVAILDLSRARTRRFEAVFLLGLEEGTLPRRGQRLAVPRRRRARRARPAGRCAARAARPRRARALPLLHRLHARDAPADARARGGHRRGQPARAERVLGRGGRALRPRGRPRAGRAAGRSRGSPGSSSRRRPSASGCVLSPCSRRREPDEAEALAARERLERQLERARRAFTRETRLRHPRVLAELSAQVAVQRHRARALRRLLVRLVLRAPDRPEEDRPRRRRDAARLGRAHDAAPLLRGPAEGDRGRPGRREQPRRRARAARRVSRRRARRRPDGDDRARAARARAEPASRSRAARPRRGSLASPLVPRRFEVGFGSDARPGAAARARPRRRPDALRQDRPDRRRPGQRARDRPGLQVGPYRPLGGRDREGARLQIPLYMLVLRDLVGIEPLGGLYRPLAGERRARGLLRRRRRTTRCPGSSRTTTSTRRRSGRRSTAPRARARPGAAHPRGRRAPRPEGDGRLPRVVRPLADVQGQARR